MKKATFTLIRPRGWMSIIGRSVFLVLFAWCMVGSLHSQTLMNTSNDTRDNNTDCDHAGNTFTECGAVYTDDGGADLYNDYLEGDNDYRGPFVWTFCPDVPMTNKVRLSFSEFDIAAGDDFIVYEGMCADPLTDGLTITGNAVGGMLVDGAVGPSSNAAGTLSAGAGWVEAGCSSISGCVTVSWTPDRQNTKGLGWKFTSSCASRNAGVRSPNHPDPDIFTTKARLNNCDATMDISIPRPGLTGCANATSIPDPYVIQVLHNGISLGYFTHADFGVNPDLDINIGAGNHWVEYILYYDPTGAGSGNNRSELMEKARYSGGYTIQDATDLVGNNNINVSLGVDCWTELSLDHVLEGFESLLVPGVTPATLNAGYTLTVSDKDGSSSSGAMSTDPTAVVVNVGIGEYDYRVRDACGNAVGGTISVVDFQGPTCPGDDVQIRVCSDAPDPVAPAFKDCSGIDSTSLSHDDIILGNCGLFTTAERDQIVALTYFDESWFRQVGDLYTTTTQVYEPFGDDIDGDDIVSIDVDGDGMMNDAIDNLDEATDHLVSNVTVRSWKATDNLGNTSEGCLQIFINVRPIELNDPSRKNIVVSCGQGTTPRELAAGDDINGNAIGDDWVAPSFSVVTGSGSSASGVIFPDEHAACGWIASYEDREIPACGNSKKIIRTWSWLDWCTPNSQPSVGFTQTIEVTDNVEPAIDTLFSQPTDMNRPLDHFECETDVRLDSVQWTDACGDIASYRTELRTYADPDGDGDFKEHVETAQVLWRNNENGGSFAALKPGTYWVLYFATDECGNETSSIYGVPGNATNDWIPEPANVYCTTLTVADEVVPQAQCDDQINLSLGTDWGRIRAEDVDEGSFDNCWIGSIEVALEDVDTLYAPFVDIDCDNVHDSLKVYLRVSDESGNSSVCWGHVVVEDKIRPVCEAPADITLNCDDLHFGDLLSQEGDITGTALMVALNSLAGTPTCADNLSCVELGMTQSITIDDSDCGEYTIVRTFVADDWNQSSTPVSQTITVEYRPDWKLTFPADATITCADVQDGAIPAALGATDIIVSEGPCDQLTLNVEEKTFTGGSDACIKIVRTYTVWNNCGEGDTYNVNASAGTSLMVTHDSTDAQVITYVQTITADITTGPTVDVTLLEEDDNNIFGSTDKDGNNVCASPKTFEAWAHDCLGNLVPSGNVTIVITDAEGNEITPIATEDLEGGILVTIDAEPGTYTAEAWAVDGCGNSSGATTSETFEDAKAPSLWLINGLATEIMPVGQAIDIWASDFLNGVGDNCSDTVTLGIWHPVLGTDAPAIGDTAAIAALGQSLLFGCNNLGNNIVRVYATDAAGNSDYVETYIIIQDNNGVCPQDPVTPTSPKEVQVAGKVVNQDGELVEAVTVAVNGGMSSDMTTGTAGIYTFTVPADGDYTITPEKDIQPLNGVSTFDLVLISKHILDLEPFTSPYQYIAADINQSGTITAFDMVQLRQLILNITTEFQNNTSWRFVDASYDFGTDATTTLAQSFPEVMNINNISGDMLTVDFIGVKIGDVNGSARPNSLVGAETRNAAGTFVLTTADQFVTAGETVNVTFTAANIAEVAGYQFTMNFAGLELASLVDGVAKAENFNTSLRGALATSWNGEADANAALFTATFTAQTSGLLSNLMNVNSDVTTAEAYSKAGEAMDIALEFTGSVASGFELMQNTPNPFNGETVIGFTLPQAGSATLTVMDVQGKVLRAVTNDFVKGYNQISLNAKELGATGILHYQLESASNVATKKMIILE